MKYFCSKCEKNKPESEFHVRPVNAGGKRPVAYHCKECRSKRIRQRDIERQAFKTHGTICATCLKPKRLVTKDCRKCLTDKGLRKCTRCSEVKVLLLDFWATKSVCIVCCTAASERYTEKVATKQAWLQRPEWERKLHIVLKTKYKIGIDEYKALLERQGGLCAICKRPPVGNRRLAVDHCHRTGHVRALLCINCNLGLGNFQDSAELLMLAAKYLEVTKPQASS